MTATYKTIKLGPGEGNAATVLGFDITVKAHREETDPPYGLIELKAPIGLEGPPLHVHHDFEEGLYILEGEATIKVGDQDIKGPPGTFVKVPRGVAHTINNTGTGPMTFLMIATPGGHEKFFEEFPDVVATHGDPLPMEVLIEHMRKHDMYLVG